MFSLYLEFTAIVIYTALFTLIYLYLFTLTYLYLSMLSLYYYMNLIKLIKYGKYKNYLEAATGGVLKNLVIFTGKHLCWSHFLIKLQPCNYGKETPTQVFSLHIRKFLKTPILKNISKRLLLIILLVQQFNCFPMSFYNYKEKLIFR